MLDTEESVKKAHDFLLDLQEDSWDMQNIFMSYNMLIAKVLGINDKIMEEAPEHAKKHFRQVQNNFKNVLGFKE